MSKKSTKLYYFIDKYLTSENIKTFILFALVLYIVCNQIISNEFSLKNLIDTKILITIIVVLFADWISNIIRFVFQNYVEDYAKQTHDYNYILNKYCLSNKITYKQDGSIVELPYELICEKPNTFNIEILDDEDSFYKLPKQIENRSKDIFKVHEGSIIYNNINIRLDDIQKTNDVIKLYTSRTYYYDSLITNRACDFNIRGENSIRDIFEPGPYLNSLKCTRMSNHLGFNGFIVTSDNKVPLVLRSRHVSIAKGVLATSVSASLKTMYAVPKGLRKFTLSGLANAIKHEVHDELNLDIEDIDDSHIINSIKYFYRDLLDGGKPQFFILIKVGASSEDLIKAFYNNINNDKQIIDKVKKDGNEIILFDVKDLINARIPMLKNSLCEKYDLDNLVINDGTYHVHPGVPMSISLLRNCL